MAACSLSSGSGGGTTTLPTLAPSSAATTLAPTTLPPTAPPTTIPLTAPGPPSTGTTIPDLVTTLPPGVTTSSLPGPARYVDEPPEGALQLGHKGRRVQTMQGQLLELGYQLGVDGYFGRGTEAAVVAFQQAQGINPDGIAGPDTLARLAQLVPTIG
jgi:peptidoglycan hydrolase-like protein with peptidoglycan-binding domain